MGLFGSKLTDQERAEELFSPYIDGQVTAGEKQFLERYLADHPETREKFELLRAAVQMTKTLPPVKAPRSFVLPRTMARKPSLAVRMYPALRFATVAAVALFAFALIGDLTTSSRLQLAARAPEMVISERSREQAEPAASAPAALLAPATPAAMPTATPVPQATPAPGAEGAATAFDATAVASEPALPAEQATAIADSTKTQLEQPAPTVEASAGRSAVEAARADSSSSVAQPPPAQVDALRLAVLVLAGLAVILGVTTLIIRRRVR